MLLYSQVSNEGEYINIPLFNVTGNTASSEEITIHISLSFKVFIKKTAEQQLNEVEQGADVVVEAHSASNDIDWDNGVWELMCESHMQSWGGGLSMPDNWHCIGINLKHNTNTEFEDTSNILGIDFIVDGAHRRKTDNALSVSDCSVPFSAVKILFQVNDNNNESGKSLYY